MECSVDDRWNVPTKIDAILDRVFYAGVDRRGAVRNPEPVTAEGHGAAITILRILHRTLHRMIHRVVHRVVRRMIHRVVCRVVNRVVHRMIHRVVH